MIPATYLLYRTIIRNTNKEKKRLLPLIRTLQVIPATQYTDKCTELPQKLRAIQDNMTSITGDSA